MEHYLEGPDAKEITEALGVGHRAVRQWLSRSIPNILKNRLGISIRLSTSSA
jgi:hypothetical protein